LVGLDFNSRLETAPAIKDIIQTSIIIKKIREHDQNQTG
jgi:phosphoribosylanthranilate isomerase